ncbi:MAG: triose-phosphate isomerase [Anaerolineae bacterium]
MRTPLIAGNWKMHNTIEESRDLATDVVAATAAHRSSVDVTLAPPFTALAVVREAVGGSTIQVAAQDMHWADQGAFTGAISPVMVAEVATQVILGHSERRALFGETDDDVNRKTHAALAHGLTPIVCVGETLEQREAGSTDALVIAQVTEGLRGIAATEAARLVLAYEPVWAIGSGLACDADEAARVCGLARTRVGELFGPAAAQSVLVLYGGSVKPTNISPYLETADIDGALVGGASLEAASFAALVAAAAG